MLTGNSSPSAKLSCCVKADTFSLKTPLPRGAQSLVFILGVGPTDDAPAETSAHYLDDVHVAVLIPQAPLP